VILADRSLGGLVVARSRPGDAVKRLGAPSTQRLNPPYSCVFSWSRLGLTLEFLEFSGGKACRSGRLVTATVADGEQWRTALGLRVGDTVARLQQLYPGAARHARGYADWRGYWLITRRSCAEGGGARFPGLLARVRAGRVSALVVGTTACE
jgi:hypothetical protein